MTPGYYWFLTTANGWQPVHIDDVGHIRLIGVAIPVASVSDKLRDRIGDRITPPEHLACSRCHGSGKEPRSC